MTTKMDERYEGHFLDALDLPEGMLVAVVIDSIADPYSEKDATGKPIKAAILVFKKKQKRLILNTTNFKNLKAMFSKDPKDWIGKTINIQRRYLDAAHGFGVNNTLCIRIVPPVGTPILKSAANFMGAPQPYGDVPKQQTKAPPPSGANGFAGTLSEWKQGIDVMKTLENCAEFRRDHLPTVPTHLVDQVSKALSEREAAIKGAGA